MKPITTFKNILLTTILFFCVSVALAQMSITFPKSRIVFQRTNANFATVPIMGHFSVQSERIEARAVPMAAGQGQITAWQTIQTNPQGGFFSGNLGMSGGWYKIEVRSMISNSVIETANIERIGVGEVFLVSGQSNAKGFTGKGSPNPNDDRVNTVNFINETAQIEQLPQPQFEKMTAEGAISPYGKSAWCWGALGDQLVAKLNVPVLFYNAAWDGTSVRVWKESINGTALSDYKGLKGENLYYPPKQPYANMRLALHYYAATTGVRAVLWHQGETDNQFNTPIANYVNDLKAVINQSRADLGRDVPWVVAKASYFELAGGVDANVIAAQNQVIATTDRVFDGPNTDDVQIPRPDKAHFSNEGLIALANRWNESLNSTFFGGSAPVQNAYPTISGSCGNNQLNIAVSGSNMTKINWTSGTTGLTNSLNAGQHQGQVVDNVGNVYYMPTINVPNGLPLCQTPTAGCVVDRVRLKFRNDCCFQRLIGATIQGSTNGTTWQTLYTINERGTGSWQEFRLNNSTPYREIRFVAGPTGYGELHELEFYNGTNKLKGTAFGTTGKDSYNSFGVALDNNENSHYWHGPDLTPGAANYVGLLLECNAITPPPTPPTTPPSSTKCIVNKVRLKFRDDCCLQRLLGATIQGSDDGSQWNTLYTINQNGTGKWQEFTFTNNTGYNQIRLAAGAKGFGEIHELEFYNDNKKLTGTHFGTAGKDRYNGYEVAFDGNESGIYWHGFDDAPGVANYAGLVLNQCETAVTPTPPVTPPTPPVTPPTVASICVVQNAGIGNALESGTYNFTVASAGKYTIKIAYRSTEKPQGVTALLSVNGSTNKSFHLSTSIASPNFIREITISQDLITGKNSLKFTSGGDGYYLISKVCIEGPNNARLSINTEKELSIFEVYPNPTQHSFIAKHKLSNDNFARWQIVDLQGKIIREEIDAFAQWNTEKQFEVSSLPIGKYIVRFIHDGIIESKIIVKY